MEGVSNVLTNVFVADSLCVYITGIRAKRKQIEKKKKKTGGIQVNKLKNILFVVHKSKQNKLRDESFKKEKNKRK